MGLSRRRSPFTLTSNGAGPLAHATASLVAWLEEQTKAEVALGPADGSGGLTVWQLELQPERELRTSGRREPMRLLARHLVLGETEALDRALVAAAAAGEPTVSTANLTGEVWQSLGLRPQFALLFDMPVQVERPTPEVPLVTEALQLDLTPKEA